MSKADHVLSPVTGHRSVQLVATFPVSDIVQRWRAVYGIDVATEFGAIDEAYLYRCSESTLEFFHPKEMAGSPALYDKLQQFSWYYQPWKWEHNVALRRIAGLGKILEVGCGDGAFLEEAEKVAGVVEGVEVSKAAVDKAKARGLVVHEESLEELSRRKPEEYDAVCAFQVLEHLGEVREFFGSVLRLVRPGGSVFIAVPNNEGFVGWDMLDPLNAPPHHMLRWRESAFRALEAYLPLKVEEVQYEPLAEIHSDWYALMCARRYIPIPGLRSVAFFAIRGCVSRRGIRARIRGHSIFVRLRKVSNGAGL